MQTVSLIPKKHSIAKMLNLLGQKNFPHLVKSLNMSANLVLREWRKRVAESNAKEGWKRNYINSIRIENVKDAMKRVVSAEGLYVNLVEDGVKSYDQKPGFMNSKYAKTNKKGEKYLRIFMRKKLKDMPEPIRREASGLNLKDTISSTDTGIYQGLTKVGDKKQSQYGTFRIVKRNSKGWIYPNVSPVKIYPTLKTALQQDIKKLLMDGLMKDLELQVRRNK
jgi:hypothetical protein